MDSATSGGWWSALFRPHMAPWEVATRAALVYLFVQLLFRVLGRRELGRWGLPDVVLLFLIGTSVRTTIVGSDTSLTSAAVGLSTIALLDWVLSVLTTRSERAANLLEGRVRQLVRDGEIQHRELRRVRVSASELLAYVHQRGGESLEDVKQAFLERSGKVTVVLRRPGDAPPRRGADAVSGASARSPAEAGRPSARAS